MKQNDKNPIAPADGSLKRRNFLRGMGVATGAAVAAPALASEADESESPEEQTKGRYQESEHVKRFYALNRL